MSKHESKVFRLWKLWIQSRLDHCNELLCSRCVVIENPIKMKILQTIREYFGYLAIDPTPKKFRLNLQQILTIILFSQFALALLAFFLFTATRLEEYVDCFYGLVTAPLNVITFTSNAWKSQNIFNLINDLEKAIQKR